MTSIIGVLFEPVTGNLGGVFSWLYLNTLLDLDINRLEISVAKHTERVTSVYVHLNTICKKPFSHESRVRKSLNLLLLYIVLGVLLGPKVTATLGCTIDFEVYRYSLI